VLRHNVSKQLGENERKTISIMTYNCVYGSVIFYDMCDLLVSLMAVAM